MFHFCFTLRRARRRIFERILFPALPYCLTESGSGETGFGSELRDLRSKIDSLLHSTPAAPSHNGTPLSPLLSGSRQEAGHEPIINLIAERQSDVIAERDLHSSVLEDSKRLLLEVEVVVVNVKVEKKSFV